MTAVTPQPGTLEAARRYPPVDGIAVVALGLVIVGGVLMASYVPRPAPLAVPSTLLAVALALLLADVVILLRLKEFAWRKFFLVFRWSLLAYAISAGMIEFAFVKDGSRGASLAVTTGMLLVFAVSVPITIAYTVGRYALPDPPS
jgi:hypothetical protein